MSSDDYPSDLWILEMFKGWYDPCPLLLKEDVLHRNGLATEWWNQRHIYVNPPYSEPHLWALVRLIDPTEVCSICPVEVASNVASEPSLVFGTPFSSEYIASTPLHGELAADAISMTMPATVEVSGAINGKNIGSSFVNQQSIAIHHRLG